MIRLQPASPRKLSINSAKVLLYRFPVFLQSRTLVVIRPASIFRSSPRPVSSLGHVMLGRIGVSLAIGFLKFLAVIPYGVTARFDDGRIEHGA